MSGGDSGLPPKPKPEEVTPDKNAAKEQAELEDKKEAARKGERGTLGRFFGGGREKAGNIAGLMTLLCFGGIVVLITIGLITGKWERFDAGLGILGTTLTACLGYLFGRR